MQLVIGLIILLVPIPAPHVALHPGGPPLVTGRARSTDSALPLAFEVNRGQASPAARFLAHGSGYTLLMTATGPVLTMSSWSRAPRSIRPSDRIVLGRSVAQTTLRLSFVGAAQARISGLDRLPGRANYLIGRDPRHWHTDIPTYARVVYRNVYPAVDLAYYGLYGHLEYDIVVRPGARLHAVALRFAGARRLLIDRVGNLHIATNALASAVQDRPADLPGERRPVTSHCRAL